jgi:hypothetical protein
VVLRVLERERERERERGRVQRRRSDALNGNVENPVQTKQAQLENVWAEQTWRGKPAE